MDLTIPYTFYPSSLPNEIAWALFLLANIASFIYAILTAWVKVPKWGLLLVFPVFVGFLILTKIAGMVITFFTTISEPYLVLIQRRCWYDSRT